MKFGSNFVFESVRPLKSGATLYSVVLVFFSYFPTQNQVFTKNDRIESNDILYRSTFSRVYKDNDPVSRKTLKLRFDHTFVQRTRSSNVHYIKFGHLGSEILSFLNGKLHLKIPLPWAKNDTKTKKKLKNFFDSFL